MVLLHEGNWEKIMEEVVFDQHLKVSTEFRYAEIEEEVDKWMDDSWMIHSFQNLPMALLSGDQASWCLHSGDEEQGHKKLKRHEQETWSGLWRPKGRVADNKFATRSWKVLNIEVKYLDFIQAFWKEISKTSTPYWS